MSKRMVDAWRGRCMHNTNENWMFDINYEHKKKKKNIKEKTLKKRSSWWITRLID